MYPLARHWREELAPLIARKSRLYCVEICLDVGSVEGWRKGWPEAFAKQLTSGALCTLCGAALIKRPQLGRSFAYPTPACPIRNRVKKFTAF